VRAIVADDALIVRRGIVALLVDAGVDVVGEAHDSATLIATVAATAPDLAVVDIRMPPTHTDEGVRAANQLRREHPGLAIVLLSQYVDVSLAVRLLERDERRIAYLLKDRVTEPEHLVDAIERVADGGTVVDPLLVDALVDRSGRTLSLEYLLTFRELRVLSLLAEGRSDRSIASELILSPKTVETHISRIFNKLGLPSAPEANRRVHAVLRYLRDLETPRMPTPEAS